MTDILLAILGALLVAIGLVGSVLPVIPGPPLSFVGLFLLRFTGFVAEARGAAFDRLLWVTAGATALVMLLDAIVPSWGARRFGASRYGMVGAALGLLVGLFFGLPGILIGPFLGALLAELLAGRGGPASLRAGFGSFLGLLTGAALKLAASGAIALLFIRELFTR